MPGSLFSTSCRDLLFRNLNVEDHDGFNPPAVIHTREYGTAQAEHIFQEIPMPIIVCQSFYPSISLGANQILPQASPSSLQKLLRQSDYH